MWGLCEMRLVLFRWTRLSTVIGGDWNVSGHFTLLVILLALSPCLFTFTFHSKPCTYCVQGGGRDEMWGCAHCAMCRRGGRGRCSRRVENSIPEILQCSSVILLAFLHNVNVSMFERQCFFTCPYNLNPHSLFIIGTALHIMSSHPNVNETRINIINIIITIRPKEEKNKLVVDSNV